MPTILITTKEAALYLLDLMQNNAPDLYQAFMDYKPFVSIREGWLEWIPFPSIRTPEAGQFLPLVQAACDHFNIPIEEASWVALAARQIKDGVELKIVGE